MIVQDSMRVEGFGVVSPPPTVESIKGKLVAAADVKEAVTLSAGEVRVLVSVLG